MRYRDLRSALATSAAICAVAVATPAMAQTKTFDVPAQSAATGIPQLATQADVQILVNADAVNGKTIRAIKGSMTVDQAVRRAAADAGLRVVSSDGRTYTLAAASSANAGNVATPAADDYAGTEIIVTAQKRAESVQDVPIAVSVLSQQDLTAQKIEGGPDIMRAVPNLTFSKSNFTGYNLSIRGVGTKSISATSDPGVAVAFGNVGLIHNRFFEQEFFDMERVEVLRGPQGTLYGRNATGGVVNLIPAKVDLRDFEGSIKGEVGNYNSRRMTAMVNVPIVDDVLGVRVAGSMTQRSGYDYNSVTGNRINGRDLWSLRTTVSFEPEPWFRASAVWERFSENDNRSRTGKQLCHRDDGPEAIGNRLISAGLSQTEGSAENYTEIRRAIFSQGCKPGSLYDDAAFGTPNGLSLPYILAPIALKQAGFLIGFRRDPSLPPSNWNNFRTIIQERDPYGGLMQSPNLREVASVRDPIYRASADLLTFNLDLDIMPSLTFISQTAYNEDKTYSFQDYNRFNSVPIFTDTSLLTRQQGGAGGPSAYANLAPGGIFCDPQIGCSDTIAGFDISSAKSKQFSQEFRLQSSFDGPFNFSVGGNYTRFKTLTDYYVMFNMFSALAQTGVFNGQYSAPAFQPGICTLVDFSGTGSVATDDPRSGCPYVDPNPLESIDGNGHNYFRSKNPYKLRSYAAFGEAYLNVSDTVKITAGLRYTDDRKRFTPVPSQLLLAPSVAAGGTVPAGYPELPDIVQNWGEFTGRLGVDWKPELSFTDDTLLYAFYSRGYKGGGANPPSPGFATIEESLAMAEAAGIPQSTLDLWAARNYLPVLQLTAVDYGPTFEPEYVNAFEIGAKNSFMNGALTLNATAFYYDYTDYQVSQIKDRTAVNENFDAKVWGAELEARFAPTRNLRFNANIGYLKTKIGKGETSIDIMNRTQGNSDYVLVKPWLQLPSNCVIPVGVAETWLTTRLAGAPLANYWSLCGGVGGVVNGLFGFPPTDPATGQAYDVANYPELNGGAGIRADLSGNELPNSPRWTANLGAEYTIEFDPDWSATIRGDGYWQAKSWARVYNSNPYDRLKSWTNFNLSLRVDGPEDLTFEAYVKNVFNSTPITDSFLNSDDTGLTTNVFVLDPRIIGFSIAKRF